jgi:hypothetical protein
MMPRAKIYSIRFRDFITQYGAVAGFQFVGILCCHFFYASTAQMRRLIFTPDASDDAWWIRDVLLRVSLMKSFIQGVNSSKIPKIDPVWLEKGRPIISLFLHI